MNEDGTRTVEEPFNTFYYPDVTEEAKARVFAIRAGDQIKGLKIVVPKAAENGTSSLTLRRVR